MPPTLKALARARRVQKRPLKEYLRTVDGGLAGVLVLLEFNADDKDAQAILDALQPRMRGDATLSYDVLAEALEELGMADGTFVGVVSRCSWEFGVNASKLIFANMYPSLMKASLDRAIQFDSPARERMHFEAAGHVPTSKGISIINANVNRNSADRPREDGDAPAFAATARQVVRDLPPA